MDGSDYGEGSGDKTGGEQGEDDDDKGYGASAIANLGLMELSP